MTRYLLVLLLLFMTAWSAEARCGRRHHRHRGRRAHVAAESVPCHAVTSRNTGTAAPVGPGCSTGACPLPGRGGIGIVPAWRE